MTQLGSNKDMDIFFESVVNRWRRHSHPFSQLLSHLFQRNPNVAEGLQSEGLDQLPALLGFAALQHALDVLQRIHADIIIFVKDLKCKQNPTCVR